MSQEPPKSLPEPGAGESETTVEQGLRLPENLKPSPVGFEGSEYQALRGTGVLEG